MKEGNAVGATFLSPKQVLYETSWQIVSLLRRGGCNLGTILSPEQVLFEVCVFLSNLHFKSTREFVRAKLNFLLKNVEILDVVSVI